MKTVDIRNISIGSGMPKICVPIVGKTETEILQQAEALKAYAVDVVEWRMDWFEEVEEQSAVTAMLKKLRACLGDMALLATFRSKKEGGERELSKQAYVALNTWAVESGDVDLVDVELFTGDDAVKQIVETAHARGVRVIMSSHDFDKTPAQEEIEKRLFRMQELGADIPKIAVMPQSNQDVLTLLSATDHVSAQLDCPIITMSMAGNGMISRLAGEVFHSALTFGAVGKASAPGQIPVEELAQVLSIIHEHL